MKNVMNLHIDKTADGSDWCIHPEETRRKRAGWIMWLNGDGSARLWIERDETGGLEGPEIRLPKNITRNRRSKSYDKYGGIKEYEKKFFPK